MIQVIRLYMQLGESLYAGLRISNTQKKHLDTYDVTFKSILGLPSPQMHGTLMMPRIPFDRLVYTNGNNFVGSLKSRFIDTSAFLSKA